MGRRSFLKGSAVEVAGLASAVPFQALFTRPVSAVELPYSPDYGPLAPVNDENTGLPLLLLPAGFRYISYGWTGDPMRDGTPTPGAHDGMAVVMTRGHQVVLVRNHELGSGTPFTTAKLRDDAGAAGLTPRGEIFPFAQNNVVLHGEKNGLVGDFRGREWAGATYSPDSRWLFVNIQTPGITFAITGPWDNGAL
jgi:secreted PhoX family phosphatase